MADMRMVNGGLKTLAAVALTVLTAAGSGCASKVSEEARAIPVEPAPIRIFSRPLNSAMEQMTTKTQEDGNSADGARRPAALGRDQRGRYISAASRNLRALGKTTATN